jgi:hypothetical protein
MSRPRVWGRLAKCSDAVISVSYAVETTQLVLVRSKVVIVRGYVPSLHASLITVNAYALILFFSSVDIEIIIL